jgi:tetratricopeptide (TPR) repeat protein
LAKISLKDHLGIIEDLIQEREIDAALAHCRHILQTYPKHVDTYRLMAKSYLEEKRFSDAGDIFQRVLSSTPDDFISHVGMSIIREEDGDEDGAVWHMERAFEAQPSNRAVQDELRRLYNNKEGFAPTKVRLTQGALARMYSHGDLHTQAISELNAALSDDPNRPDLEILLAEMYFKTQQINEALTISSQILDKLPYCLSANLLIAEILISTDRNEEAITYIERARELDPYSSLESSEEVSPDEHMLDEFEFDPNVPQELISESADNPQPAAALDHGIAPANSDDTPKELSSSSTETDTAGNEETAQPDGEALAEGEIPEWLRELLPDGEMSLENDQEADLPSADSSNEAETSEDEMSPAAEKDGANDDLGWLEALAAEEGAPEDELLTAPDERELGTPKWLETESTEGKTDESMAWLDDLDSDEETAPTEQSPENGEEEPIVSEASGSEPPALTQTPDWLKDLAEEAENSTQPSGDLQAEALEQAPDWLDELQEIGAQEDDEPLEEVSPREEAPEIEVEESTEVEAPTFEELDELAPSQPDENSDWIPEATIEESETVLLPDEKVATVADEEDTPASSTDQSDSAEKVESDGLELARQALNYDKLDDALAHYKKILRNRDTQDEVIADLQAALSKYPKHVGLWQMLGDAYMGKDRLRDALESYTKAEDLL